ncbi:hypothetical protein GCM10027605_69490 [Micromonospora zhanjiangensis]
MLAVGLVLLAGGVAGAGVGAARVGHQQARVAADLGALAGAARAADGADRACARAADLVAANGGRLVGCAVDGLDIRIRVESTVAPLPRLTMVATGAARAGPIRSG